MARLLTISELAMAWGKPGKPLSRQAVHKILRTKRVPTIQPGHVKKRPAMTLVNAEDAHAVRPLPEEYR